MHQVLNQKRKTQTVQLDTAILCPRNHWSAWQEPDLLQQGVEARFRHRFHLLLNPQDVWSVWNGWLMGALRAA